MGRSDQSVCIYLQRLGELRQPRMVRVDEGDGLPQPVALFLFEQRVQSEEVGLVLRELLDAWQAVPDGFQEVRDRDAHLLH